MMRSRTMGRNVRNILHRKLFVSRPSNDTLFKQNWWVGHCRPCEHERSENPKHSLYPVVFHWSELRLAGESSRAVEAYHYARTRQKKKANNAT